MGKTDGGWRGGKSQQVVAWDSVMPRIESAVATYYVYSPSKMHTMGLFFQANNSIFNFYPFGYIVKALYFDLFFTHVYIRIIHVYTFLLCIHNIGFYV